MGVCDRIVCLVAASALNSFSGAIDGRPRLGILA
jgi:hypothetical protein